MPTGPRPPRRPQTPRLQRRRRLPPGAGYPPGRLLAAAAALALLVGGISLLSPREAGRLAAARPVTGAPDRPAPAAGDAAEPARPSEATPAPPPEGEPPRPASGAPRAALIIDDLGQSFAHFEAVAALGLPLSAAILPGLPATRRTAREARKRGIETLLHLPMEPRESPVSPGEKALLTSLPPAQIADRLRDAVAAVPEAVGVNNHMGSRFTADPAAMAVLMAGLRGRGLFWIDSRTTGATVGTASATAAGVPTAARDVFIDAELDPAFIRAQLRKLVTLARRHGSAIGIGHPHRETLAALAELRDELAESGVEWVPVSELVVGPAPAPSLARVPPGDAR